MTLWSLTKTPSMSLTGRRRIVALLRARIIRSLGKSRVFWASLLPSGLESTTVEICKAMQIESGLLVQLTWRMELLQMVQIFSWLTQ